MDSGIKSDSKIVSEFRKGWLRHAPFCKKILTHRIYFLWESEKLEAEKMQGIKFLGGSRFATLLSPVENRHGILVPIWRMFVAYPSAS